MATWIPGSYVIREFARNVEGVRASGPNGQLPVHKVSKNTWRVDCVGEQPVRLEYQVASNELSVRTSYVDTDGAVLNPAAWAMLPPGDTGPFKLSVASAWPDVATGLARVAGDYVAADIDALMDAPMLLGVLESASFDVQGVPHSIATLGGTAGWSDPKVARDLARIVQVHSDFWGGLPYERYLFLNAAMGGRGGLEHRDSTLLLTEPHAVTDDQAYDAWLSIASHELFHVWNVKRLRPAGLVPYDYAHETYTPDLWVAEGLTSYYDDLLLARAGVIDEDQLLTAMSREVHDTFSAPGRFEQSLSQSSMDAWVEFYRPDAHTVNQAVSYYRKGALVGWLLDVEIREASGGRRSLDDAMRLAFARFGASPDGYTSQQFRDVLSEVAGRDLGPWLAKAVDGTEELELKPALDAFGLKLVDTSTETGAFHGASLSLREGRVFVESVPRGTPAWDAGLMPDDELLAVDDWRVAGSLAVVKRTVPGASRWLVARRGAVRQVLLELVERPEKAFTLQIDPTASQTARRARAAWLGGN